AERQRPPPVVRRPHEGARLDESPPRADEVGDLADLPSRVVHAGPPLVGPSRRLLEEAQVMVVERAGNLEEGRVRILLRHLEAEEIAVEVDASLHVGYPEDEMLQSPEPDTVAHHEPPGTSTLT